MEAYLTKRLHILAMIALSQLAVMGWTKFSEA